jgi:hypothetical protein
MPDENTGSDPAEKRSVGLPPGTMKDSHKVALKEGRERGRIVRTYLKAIEQTKPRRGRPRTIESIDRDIDDVDRKIHSESDPLRKLELDEKKIKLRGDRDRLANPPDLGAIEAEFVRVAKAYGESKDISAEAWLELGVPKDVLKAAGIG